MLGDGLRYAHSEPYLRGVLRHAGLRLVVLEPHSARKHHDQPTPGFVIVASKP